MGTLGLFAARVDQVTCGPVLYVFGRFVKHMPQTFSSVLLWVKVQHGQVHDWVGGASACCAILFLHLACRASSLLRSFRIACFSLGSLSGLSMGRVSSGLICVRCRLWRSAMFWASEASVCWISFRFFLSRVSLIGETIVVSSLYRYHHRRACIGSRLFLFSQSSAKKVKRSSAILCVVSLYFVEPLSLVTSCWSSLRMIPWEPVGEAIHRHACRICLCQSSSVREKLSIDWFDSSVTNVSSCNTAAGQNFLCQCLSVWMAMRMSAFSRVFAFLLMPRISPIERCVVPFFLGFRVEGGKDRCIQRAGMVAIRAKCPWSISACVSASSSTTPKVFCMVSERFSSADNRRASS